MKTKKKKRNYAATDATLINIRALKKKVKKLEADVSFLLFHFNSVFGKKRGKK